MIEYVFKMIHIPRPLSTTALAPRDPEGYKSICSRTACTYFLIVIVNNVLHAVENRCTYMITYPFAVCRCRRLSRTAVS